MRGEKEITGLDLYVSSSDFAINGMSNWLAMEKEVGVVGIPQKLHKQIRVFTRSKLRSSIWIGPDPFLNVGPFFFEDIANWTFSLVAIQGFFQAFHIKDIDN